MKAKNESFSDLIKENLDFFSLIGMEYVLDESPLKAINEAIVKCGLCSLSEQRTHAVPGEGSLDSKLMFVGEAPGQDEDKSGRPFVGRAGKLLTRIIQAMNFQREEVYITNVIKCRPPNNRNPNQDEIEKCQNYLMRQIEVLKPRVIVTLGKVATDFFVPGGGSMRSLRGSFHPYHDVPVMPTFHPSYLVRNEGNRELKKMVWEDMQKVMAFLAKK